MKRLLLGACLAIAARAVDVSGNYENIGTVVSTPLDSPGGGVPFRGLIELDFNLPVMRLLHSGTARFELHQSPGGFTMRCFEPDGTESWGGSWDRGPGCGIEEQQVKLVFRAPRRFGDNAFLFILSPVHQGTLLSVEVYFVKSTSFGPGMKPLGTFVFARLPQGRLAAR